MWCNKRWEYNQPTDIVVESEGKILAVPPVSLVMHIFVDGGKTFRGVLS